MEKDCLNLGKVMLLVLIFKFGIVEYQKLYICYCHEAYEVLGRFVHLFSYTHSYHVSYSLLSHFFLYLRIEGL